MYSSEFMRFLYNYQKEDFKPKEAESYEIYFNDKGSGKPAEIVLAVENKQ